MQVCVCVSALAEIWFGHLWASLLTLFTAKVFARDRILVSVCLYVSGVRACMCVCACVRR